MPSCTTSPDPSTGDFRINFDQQHVPEKDVIAFRCRYPSALELTRIHRDESDAGSHAPAEGPIGPAIPHIIELALGR